MLTFLCSDHKHAVQWKGYTDAEKGQWIYSKVIYRDHISADVYFKS